jgi:hypothetical protein
MLALARSSILDQGESPVEDFLNVCFWPKADAIFA